MRIAHPLRAVLIFFVVMPLIIVLSETVVAAETGTVVCQTGLNVRSLPGTNGAIVGTLYPNDVVDILDRSGSWLRIRTSEGIEGWVYGKYIRIGHTAGEVGEGSTEPPRQPSADEESPQVAAIGWAGQLPSHFSVAPKIGVLLPSMVPALVPAIEIPASFRLSEGENTDYYIRAALGYAELSWSILGDSFGKGYWTWGYVDAVLELRTGTEVSPYCGGGVGLHYYRFTVEVDEGEEALADAVGSLDDDDRFYADLLFPTFPYEKVNGFGSGFRGFFGLKHQLSSGALVGEVQLLLSNLKHRNRFSLLLLCGYEFFL